nr:hypothetical protein [Tanacetum cinerariifolium]
AAVRHERQRHVCAEQRGHRLSQYRVCAGGHAGGPHRCLARRDSVQPAAAGRRRPVVRQSGDSVVARQPGVRGRGTGLWHR